MAEETTKILLCTCLAPMWHNRPRRKMTTKGEAQVRYTNANFRHMNGFDHNMIHVEIKWLSWLDFFPLLCFFDINEQLRHFESGARSWITMNLSFAGLRGVVQGQRKVLREKRETHLSSQLHVMTVQVHVSNARLNNWCLQSSNRFSISLFGTCK